MELTGRSIIGGSRGEAVGPAHRGFNPVSGEHLEPGWHAASAEEVERAVTLASTAFDSYRRLTGREKGAFLRTIASRIESISELLTARAVAESGLPIPRIQGEIGRTCNQLRMFAILVEEGSWVDARIDRADPQRQPIPKPDVRSMLRPLGPVVVFGASNFPLAFSVAGGDTASALAAGCPVIVKAHPSHPGTSELVGLAISEAVSECGLAEGVFSLLFGAGNELGEQLVSHPLIKAGGFTGSRTGGKALAALAASRPEPIPFYAEMSSVNPLVVLPGAMGERGESIASGLHGSVTLGAGQFCTKPGLILVRDDAATGGFISRLATLMGAEQVFTLLNPGIRQSYAAGMATLDQKSGVATLARPTIATGPAVTPGCQTAAALYQTTAASFLADHELQNEVFGPAALVVTWSTKSELLDLVRALEGQLTASIHANDQDLTDFAELLPLLETRAGRLVYNGFPTGVEVCHAMVHGGPWPSTSDGRSTSVGTRAIFRFTRQACFQGFPESRLPEELQNGNPNGIWRIVDGRPTQDSF